MSEFNPIVWNAAEAGNLHALTSALVAHPHLIDTPHPREFFKTPLYIAAEKGHDKIIEKLVELGSNAIDTAKYDTAPMHAAIWNGHTSTIKTLVRLGSQVIDVPGGLSGQTPIGVAATIGNALVVEMLMQLGCTTIDAPNRHDIPPISLAVRGGHVDCLKTLKMLGAKYPSVLFDDATGMKELLDTPIDEEEFVDLRYRVYFQRSLSARLLFEVEKQKWLRCQRHVHKI